MKKKYIKPELDFVMLMLKNEVLLSSIEQGQTATAGGDMPDPDYDDPLDWGGILN